MTKEEMYAIITRLGGWSELNACIVSLEKWKDLKKYWPFEDGYKHDIPSDKNCALCEYNHVIRPSLGCEYCCLFLQRRGQEISSNDRTCEDDTHPFKRAMEAWQKRDYLQFMHHRRTVIKHIKRRIRAINDDNTLSN